MRHLRTLRAIIAAISVLIPWEAGYLTDLATSDASEVNSAVTETDVAPCAGIGDVFQLDVPGTYVAFAINRSGPLLTEVRGTHGESLATSRPTMATTRVVDLASGLRFGVGPPQVFQVASSVWIHVDSNRSRYELMVVRIDGTREFSRLTVRPPVEPIVNESCACPAGGYREVSKIRIDAVYSDPGARQVFVVDSPNSWSTTEFPCSGSADQHDGWLETWHSPTSLHSLWTSRFFAVG